MIVHRSPLKLGFIAVFAWLFLAFANLGIPLSQHLCHGEVVSSSLYRQAPSCAGASESPLAHEFSSPPCCAQNLELQKNDEIAPDRSNAGSTPLPLLALASDELTRSDIPHIRTISSWAHVPEPPTTPDLILIYGTLLI